MPGITAFTDEEVMEVTAGTRLFKFIAEQNFAGIEGMLSKSNVGLEHLDEISNTPFLYACYLGRYPFVKYLHKRGADIMRINVFGNLLVFFLSFYAVGRSTSTSISISSLIA